MQFSKTLLLLAAVTSAVGVLAQDQAVEDILRRSKEVVNNSEAIAGSDVDALSEVAPTIETDPNWLDGIGGNLNGVESAATDTPQQRAWNQIVGETQNAMELRDAGPPHPEVPDDVVYVYISLSMPKEDIRNLFFQALEHKETIRSIFVLRGWAPPGPNELVARLNELFPDANKLRDLPNVQINPVLYEQQQIETVPTYSKKDSQGRWGTVIGTTSLVDAVDRLEEGRYDGEVIGPTFAIEEPNVLQLIRERIAQVDWNSQVEQVKDSILTKTTSGRELPHATENETYLVDLTIINNQDLAGPTGEVFALAGQTINPLEYLTTTRKYIFLDANIEAQVQQALRWRGESDYVTMITTIPVQTVEGRADVIKTLGQPLYEINDLLINRFKLKAVPSIAYQDGRMLRVDVVSVSDSQFTAEVTND